MLLSVVLVVTSSVGVTWCAMTTPILRPLRNRVQFADHLLSCPLCTGFHAGWICTAIYLLSGPWTLVPLVASLVCGLVLHNRV